MAKITTATPANVDAKSVDANTAIIDALHNNSATGFIARIVINEPVILETGPYVAWH